jgi:hypothetical protein
MDESHGVAGEACLELRGEERLDATAVQLADADRAERGQDVYAEELLVARVRAGFCLRRDDPEPPGGVVFDGGRGRNDGPRGLLGVTEHLGEVLVGGALRVEHAESAARLGVAPIDHVAFLPVLSALPHTRHHSALPLLSSWSAASAVVRIHADALTRARLAARAMARRSPTSRSTSSRTRRRNSGGRPIRGAMTEEIH